MLICSFPPQFLKETPASKGDCFIADLLPAYSQTATSISKRQNSNFTSKKATSFFPGNQLLPAASIHLPSLPCFFGFFF